MSVSQLQQIRDRFCPWPALSRLSTNSECRLATQSFTTPRTGVVGIELDPTHALHITTDGNGLFADVTYRSSRYDARSSASREKLAVAPRLIVARSIPMPPIRCFAICWPN